MNSAKRRKVLVNVTNNISGFPALYNCIHLRGKQDSLLVMRCRKELGDIRYICFKLDYKFGYEFRRILFVLHCFKCINGSALHITEDVNPLSV